MLSSHLCCFRHISLSCVDNYTTMAIQPAGRGPQVIAVYAFFAALTTVAISLRTYCRAILLRNFALDDYFAVTSWVCIRSLVHRSASVLTAILQVLFVILCAFAITGTYHGTGQHVYNIKPPSEIPVGLKVSRVVQVSRPQLTPISGGGVASQST